MRWQKNANLKVQGALYRKPLQFEDMWRLPPQDRVANLAQRFETVWDKEQQKAKPSLVCCYQISLSSLAFIAEGYIKRI